MTAAENNGFKKDFSQFVIQPGQPQRITSGLRETFIKRYVVERTNKTEIKREEQSEKAESCWENLWNEMQLKGAIKTETDTRTE